MIKYVFFLLISSTAFAQQNFWHTNIGNSTTIKNSCKEYRRFGKTITGNYKIKNGASSLTMRCDMTTDGGGWTLSFRGDLYSNYNTTNSQFLNPSVISGATEVMVMYADANLTPITTVYKFNKPSDFDLQVQGTQGFVNSTILPSFLTGQ